MNAKDRCKGSLNPEYAAVCGGKLRHENFLSAMQHAEQLEKNDGAEMAVYRCPFCSFEHVGRVNAVWNRSNKVYGIGRQTLDAPIAGAVARQGLPSPKWRVAQ